MEMTIFRQNDQPIDNGEMAEMKMTIFRHLKLSWNENDQMIDKRAVSWNEIDQMTIFDTFMKWKWPFFDKMIDKREGFSRNENDRPADWNAVFEMNENITIFDI